MNTLVRVARWLWSGTPEPKPVLCHFCEADHHVHDANTGVCITSWCECGRSR